MAPSFDRVRSACWAFEKSGIFCKPDIRRKSLVPGLIEKFLPKAVITERAEQVVCAKPGIILGCFAHIEEHPEAANKDMTVQVPNALLQFSFRGGETTYIYSCDDQIYFAYEVAIKGLDIPSQEAMTGIASGNVRAPYADKAQDPVKQPRMFAFYERLNWLQTMGYRASRSELVHYGETQAGYTETARLFGWTLKSIKTEDLGGLTKGSVVYSDKQLSLLREKFSRIERPDDPSMVLFEKV